MPLPADVIEQAITLNGTAVEQNLQAFRRGRQLVADEAALRRRPRHPVPATAAALPRGGAGSARWSPRPKARELARLLDIRVPELIAYQNADYARGYAEFVEQVRVLAPRTAVTEAVARNLYKLMAYKDEYEVARLCLDENVVGPAQRLWRRYRVTGTDCTRQCSARWA